jgi:hypothetical protein
MRKSHKQIEELIEARTHEYNSGQASEAVYRASLKALRVPRVEIELLVGRHKPANERRKSFETLRLEASARYVKDYCDASRGKDTKRGASAALRFINRQ